MKKRIVTLLTLATLMIATAAPAFAQDEPAPAPTSSLIGYLTSKFSGGYTTSLTVPVRCGNDC